MTVGYGNARELIGIKKCQGNDAKVNMCKGIMGMVEDGRVEGRMEGLSQGEQVTMIRLIQWKLQKSKTTEEIAEDMEESPIRRYHFL